MAATTASRRTGLPADFPGRAAYALAPEVSSVAQLRFVVTYPEPDRPVGLPLYDEAVVAGVLERHGEVSPPCVRCRPGGGASRWGRWWSRRFCRCKGRRFRPRAPWRRSICWRERRAGFRRGTSSQRHTVAQARSTQDIAVFFHGGLGALSCPWTGPRAIRSGPAAGAGSTRDAEYAHTGSLVVTVAAGGRLFSGKPQHGRQRRGRFPSQVPPGDAAQRRRGAGFHALGLAVAEKNIWSPCPRPHQRRSWPRGQAFRHRRHPVHRAGSTRLAPVAGSATMAWTGQASAQGTG